MVFLVKSSVPLCKEEVISVESTSSEKREVISIAQDKLEVPTSQEKVVSSTLVHRKYLIIYAYHESPSAQQSLKFLCQYGVFPSSDRQHYFVIQGEKCDVEGEIPLYDNVKVVKRPNKGFDFGAWAHIINHVNLEPYTHFVFMNASILGPFLTSYVEKSSWPHLFSQMLNSRTKLVGTTISEVHHLDGEPINCHVQSMFLMTDKVGLATLIKGGIFTGNDEDAGKRDCIIKREVRASKVIMEAGFYIDAIHPLNRGRRYGLQGAMDGNGKVSTFYDPDNLAHLRVEPLDVVFFKFQWGTALDALSKYTTITEKMLRIRITNPFQFDGAREFITLLTGEFDELKRYGWFISWMAGRFNTKMVVDLGSNKGIAALCMSVTCTGQIYHLHPSKEESAAAATTFQKYLPLKKNNDNVKFACVDYTKSAYEFGPRSIDLLYVSSIPEASALNQIWSEWSGKVKVKGFLMLNLYQLSEEEMEKIAALRLSLRCFTLMVGRIFVLCLDTEYSRVLKTEWSEKQSLLGNETYYHQVTDTYSLL